MQQMAESLNCPQYFMSEMNELISGLSFSLSSFRKARHSSIASLELEKLKFRLGVEHETSPNVANSMEKKVAYIWMRSGNLKYENLVQNLTNDSYTFAPDIIHADITKKNGTTETLRVYSNEAFQKKIKRQQAWASALYGLSAGLNAGMAGYQTSYVTTRSYNGYTYTQPVTTYNSTAAYQANMAATTQLMVLSKQMEQDKKIREEGYLKKTTIHSSEGIFGYMNVEREKGTVMRVVIPVNGENYGFHWDVANKKK